MAVFDYLKIEEIEHVSEVWSGAKGKENACSKQQRLFKNQIHVERIFIL